MAEVVPAETWVGVFITKMGVVAAVGTAVDGATVTFRSQARAARMNRETNKRVFFIIEFPFTQIIVTCEKKLPLR
jgi:hypothetical protein